LEHPEFTGNPRVIEE